MESDYLLISIFLFVDFIFEPVFYLLELSCYEYLLSDYVSFLWGIHLNMIQIPTIYNPMAPMIHPNEIPTIAPSVTWPWFWTTTQLAAYKPF